MFDFSIVKSFLILSLTAGLSIAAEPSLFLKDASYFDRDSDGYVDQIEIGFQLSPTATSSTIDYDELTALLILPPERYFTILSYSYENLSLILDVQEHTSYQNTAVMEYDTIRTMAGVLSSGNSIGESIAAVQDKMAPVVAEAVLFDSLKSGAEDYFLVKFSEEITHAEGNGEYFNLKKQFENYPMELQYQNSEELAVRFKIISEDNVSSVAQGDSLNIKEGTLSDLVGNIQMHPGNRTAAIDIVSIDEAAVEPHIKSVHNGFAAHYNRYTGIIEISSLWADGEVSIYGPSGKLIAKQQLHRGSSQINLSEELSNAVYFLEFSVGSELFTRKIAVRN